MDNDIIGIISSVGVPTALAFYVLHYIRKSIDELNKNISDLTNFLRMNYIRRAPIE